MSGFIRSIRGIERSQAYSPISAVNRYAAYRNREQIEPSRVEPAVGWEDWEAASAKSAAVWLRTAKAAEGKLNNLMIELGRQEGWRDAGVTEDKLRQLKVIVDELAAVYKRYEDHLRPEVWEVIELALRHPATEQLGLGWAIDGESSLSRVEGSASDSSLFKVEGRSSEPSRKALAAQLDRDLVRRLLLGVDGLLTGLKRAVTYAEQQQTADWLKLPFTAAYPYALYYGAAQLYWPLPSRGSILNKYI